MYSETSPQSNLLRSQRPARDEAAYEFHRTIEMSVADWIAVPDNPRQRDTEMHARRATYLDVFEPIHGEVQMVILPDGTRYKLDGHTRAYKWLHNPAGAPDKVRVSVWRCKDLKSITALYTRIDNKKAAESSQDQLTGAAREYGLDFDAPMLKSGRYGSALKRLYLFTFGHSSVRSHTDDEFVYEAVRRFRAPLILLDSVDPTAGAFPAGIVMASLASLRRFGDRALPFWARYSAGDGQKMSGSMDAVQTLIEIVLREKSKKAISTGTQQDTLFRKGVTVFQGWQRGQQYTAGSAGSAGKISDEKLKAFCRGNA